MDAIGEQLRAYAAAMADPTRAMILVELGRNTELTATQLARRLGLTANNVYHHLRILRSRGVVPPPRVVPGSSYVEKYYQLEPETRAALWDPLWLDRAAATMTATDRQALLVGMCSTMAQLLQRAARRYQMMDAQRLDEMVRDQQLGMLSITEVSRPHLREQLVTLRGMLKQAPLGSDTTMTDLVLLATLPLMWDKPAEWPE